MGQAQRVDMPGFPKGLNRESDPYLLKDGEVPEALNVDFGARGEVSRRDGYVRVDKPWEMGVAQQRILSWESDLDKFLIVLGGGDGKVWIGSLISDWTF